jgi:hypothetical protein
MIRASGRRHSDRAGGHLPAGRLRLRFGPYLVPGLPHGKGLRWVNTFAKITGDIYVPPQRNTFTVSASITNTGTHAITIESVSLPRGAGTYYPLVPAGPARYIIVRGGPGYPPAHILRNVTLRRATR